MIDWDNSRQLIGSDGIRKGCIRELADEFKNEIEKDDPHTIVPNMKWRRGTGSIPRGTVWSSFASWASRAYFPDFFDVLDSEHKDGIRDVLESKYDNDDDFSRVMRENVTVINGRHKSVGSLAEVGKQGNLEEDTDMEDEFETLSSIGAVDEDGEADPSVIRGLIAQFGGDVDDIEGESEGVNIDDLKRAFDEWMLRKLGGEWSSFTTKIMSGEDVKRHVDYMWKADEEFQMQVSEKWYDISDQQDELDERERRQKKQNLSGYNDGRIRDSNGDGSSSNSDDSASEGSGKERERIDVDSNTVLNGDSTEIINDITDSDLEIDAVITDPPYGQSYNSRGDEHEVIEGDNDLRKALSTTEEVLKKCRLSLSSGSPVVCFAGDTSLNGVMEIVDRWYTLKPVCIWDKDWVTTSSMADTPMAWRKSHEYAVIGAYGDPRVENENRHDGTVWNHQRLSGEKMDHPTQKPVDLMKYVIESLTEEGDLVFDPFAGSGSTLVAANQTGREYLGVEFDEEHYETIQGRLKQNTIAEWA